MLYRHLAAIFTVGVTTNDNKSLNSLHGPHLWPRILQQHPLLLWCSNPINYCTPRRTMNVPTFNVFSVPSLLIAQLICSPFSGKWPNLLLSFPFLSPSSVSFSSFSSYIENCYNSNWYRCFLSVYWGMSCRLMTLKMFHYLFYIIINKYASCI